MDQAPKKKRSRSSSKKNSDSAASQNSENDSINAYNWHAKYMENVRSSNSKQSLQRLKERGSPIGISADLPFSDSEK